MTARRHLLAGISFVALAACPSAARATSAFPVYVPQLNTAPATSTQLGAVKPDGTTIGVSNGAISVPRPAAGSIVKSGGPGVGDSAATVRDLPAPYAPDSNNNIPATAYGASIGTGPTGAAGLVVPPTSSGSITTTLPLQASAPYFTSPADTTAVHSSYTNNVGAATAVGRSNTYQSAATNANFDVGDQNIAIFTGTSTQNQLSKLARFTQMVTPQSKTTPLGAAIEELNPTHLGADTGYWPNLASPPSYASVAQQVGGFDEVPEANAPGKPNAGNNVQYGYACQASSHTSTQLNNDYPRTYACLLTNPNSLVPATQTPSLSDSTVNGAGGRALSLWGGTTAALAPWGIAQVFGTWAHGFDTTFATIADGTAMHLATGQAIALDTAGAVKLQSDGTNAVLPAGASFRNGTQAWATWTPAISNTSPGSTAPTYSVSQAGYSRGVDATVNMSVTYVVTAAGTASGSTQVPLPTAKANRDAVASCVDKSSGAVIYGAIGGGTAYLSLVGANSAHTYSCSAVYETQ